MKEPFETWNKTIAPQDAAAMARAKARWDAVVRVVAGIPVALKGELPCISD